MADKRKIIMAIYLTLKKETNKDKHLKQANIIEMLEKSYNLKVERKTVAANIQALQDMGINIIKDNGYYLESEDFTDNELMYIIDAVSSSKYIPDKSANKLVKHLGNLSSVDFSKRMSTIKKRSVVDVKDSDVLFSNLGIIYQAIEEDRRIDFRYNKQLVKEEIKELNSITNHIDVSPYFVLVNQGRHYLIARFNGFTKLSHLRIDKMEKIEIVSRKKRELWNDLYSELSEDQYIQNYLNVHPYMFQGKAVTAVFLIKNTFVGEVLDIFGKKTRVAKAVEYKSKLSHLVNINLNDYCRISVNADLESLALFVKQFLESVVVLEPAELRNRMESIIAVAIDNNNF